MYLDTGAAVSVNGAIYVAVGPNAVNQAQESITVLKQQNSGLPVAVIGDLVRKGVTNIPFVQPGPGARWAKLHVDLLSPWSSFCYLDADTRPHAGLGVGFRILADGWDMIITASASQAGMLLWHIGEGDRLATFAALGHEDPLQLQAGVFWARKSRKLHRFFEAWREEWKRYSDQDQGAFLRALARVPLKLWLFGRPWNGGEAIEHLYGQAR